NPDTARVRPRPCPGRTWRGCAGRGRGRLAGGKALELAPRLLDRIVAERVHDLRPVEQPALLFDRQPVLDEPVAEDLRQPAAARALAHDVGGDPVLRAGAGEEEGERAAQQARES